MGRITADDLFGLLGSMSYNQGRPTPLSDPSLAAQQAAEETACSGAPETSEPAPEAPAPAAENPPQSDGEDSGPAAQPAEESANWTAQA